MTATVPAKASTLACVSLSNTAQASFSRQGAPDIVNSNTAITRVAELLDLRLAADTATVALAPGATGAVPFTLVNLGNGLEAFLLDGAIQGADAAIHGFAVDRDADGRFDPASDLPIQPGNATPAIAAGASLPLVALVRGGAAPIAGTLTVSAHAATGSGTPGSSFTGQGDGGCDAVVGGTTASATATVSLTAAPGSDTSQISVLKSQSVSGPNGSVPVHGSVITYTIESRFGGSGVVQAVRLADPIPPGTAFAPGSVRLDGAVLSDAAAFDGGSIRVTLGDVPAPAVRILQFQVVIQ